MDNKEHTFQYATLRYTHDVVRQESENIGIVVYSKEACYLKGMFRPSKSDFYRLWIGAVKKSLNHLQEQLQQCKELDTFSDDLHLFLTRLILPDDWSSLDFNGPCGVGITIDLDRELERLFKRLVSHE